MLVHELRYPFSIGLNHSEMSEVFRICSTTVILPEWTMISCDLGNFLLISSHISLHGYCYAFLEIFLIWARFERSELGTCLNRRTIYLVQGLFKHATNPEYKIPIDWMPYLLTHLAILWVEISSRIDISCVSSQEIVDCCKNMISHSKAIECLIWSKFPSKWCIFVRVPESSIMFSSFPWEFSMSPPHENSKIECTDTP
jgi:hypothetical protein